MPLRHQRGTGQDRNTDQKQTVPQGRRIAEIVVADPYAFLFPEGLARNIKTDIRQRIESLPPDMDSLDSMLEVGYSLRQSSERVVVAEDVFLGSTYQAVHQRFLDDVMNSVDPTGDVKLELCPRCKKETLLTRTQTVARWDEIEATHSRCLNPVCT